MPTKVTFLEPLKSVFTDDMVCEKPLEKEENVIKLKGAIYFLNANKLVKEINALTLENEEVIVDFELVTKIDLSSAEKLHILMGDVEESGKRVIYKNVSEILDKRLTIYFNK